MGGGLLTTLDLLQNNWGQWKVDNAGVVRFTRKETLTRFNETQKAITAAADAQIALQRQVLDAQSQPATTTGRVPSQSAAATVPANPAPRPVASPPSKPPGSR